jgi:hypothetical protein
MQAGSHAGAHRSCIGDGREVPCGVERLHDRGPVLNRRVVAG